MTTTSQTQVANDISALLRARNPLLWVVTKEEARVEHYLVKAAAAAKYVPRMWDVAQGVTDLSGKPDRELSSANDPQSILEAIRDRARNGRDRGVWILRDIPAWLQGPAGAVQVRQLRNLARQLPGTPRDSAQSIIVLTPIAEVPLELSGHATVVEWPLPDRAEIRSILEATLAAQPDEVRKDAAPNGSFDAAIDAAIGLTGEEAQAAYAKSLVLSRVIDPSAVAQEKKRVIARDGVLEWYDPIPGGLGAVGGLGHLKAWLLQRQLAYSPKARAYGLPAPKGTLLVGLPGTGKTLTAKAVATAWQVPLLRVDLGALKSKFVGESEANLRKAFRVIKTVGRCVVWFDEIEKALAGATQGAADGGVSSDALGAILSWMQERQGEAFVIATANDVSSLPPELLRKGRFDEVWSLDLPTSEEREAILGVALVSHGRAGIEVDYPKIAKACEGFVGSEIAAIVPEALFAAYADDGREITTADLIAAAKTVVPLSKTSPDKIAKLRAWIAEGRARPASDGEQIAIGSGGRLLDI